MIDYLIWVLLGSLYGTVIGVIPVAGATIGMLSIFPMISYFSVDPYLALIFMISFVGSVSNSDSLTSILTGIPGSGSTAASIIDGYPLAQQGQAGRAIGIALMDSSINGLFYGLIAFGLLPLYGKVILFFGIPEFAALMALSLACVAFVTTKNIWLSIASIFIGLFLGAVGQNPATGAYRFTFGWDYLAAGIQIVPVIAGLFAIPELYNISKNKYPRIEIIDYRSQLLQGFKDCFIYWKDMIRGGAIGFFTGILPGIGGSTGDMLAYGATVASHPKEKFGNGNIKGLIGCEGANNAQKPGSLIPTFLFGIPGAPFAAIMMSICVILGLEIGTPALLADEKFIITIFIGFVSSVIISFFVCVLISKFLVKIFLIPRWIYFVFILAIIVWSSLQYSGSINDLIILALCGMLGIFSKEFNLSRPAILLAFVVSSRFENYLQQSLTLYDWQEIITRPLTVSILIITIMLILYKIRNSL